MTTVNADEIVACFWAIGPSYRTYLIKNLEEMIKRSPEIFKFVVLTDYADDFVELKRTTDKFLEILDINEQRKSYDWSFELEPIPEFKTDPEYGLQFRQNLHNGKRFSYSLNRFVIPWLIKNNITKFFICDTDLHLGTHHFQSIQEYVNHVLYTAPQLVAANNQSHDSAIGRVVGVGPSLIRQPINDQFYELICKITNKEPTYPELYPQLDGIFKYYDFNTVQDLEVFFNTWNNARKIEIDVSNIHLYGGAHGPIFLNDEVILGAIFYTLHIDVYVALSSQTGNIRHRTENRWFQASIGETTDSLHESIEKNRNLYTHDLYDFSHLYNT